MFTKGGCIRLKTVEFKLNGQVYYLLLNGAALFDCFDHFGDKGSLLDHITGNTRETFDNTCWMLVKFAQQGELYRRFTGEDKGFMLTVPAAQALLSPQDLVRAQEAIRETYTLAFARSVKPEEEEDIDLGLAELQKKKEAGFRGPNGFSGLLRSLASAFGKA